MSLEHALLFISLGALISLFIKRNILSMGASLIQFFLAASTYFLVKGPNKIITSDALILLLLFLSALVLILLALAVFMIRRRATLRGNELRELRG